MSDMLPVDAPQAERTFPDRRITLIILAVLTLPYILGLVVAIMFAWVSPLMVLDGPPPDTGTWIGFFMICTCPIVFIIGIAGGWISFYLKHYRLALVMMLLPVLQISVLLIAMLFIEGL